MKIAVVIMTRTPRPGRTKTRMMPHLTGEECVQLHVACLQELCQLVETLNVTPYLCFTGGQADFFQQPMFREFQVLEQKGPDLGTRLLNVSREVLKEHDGVLLMGSDTPQLSGKLLEMAISGLKSKEVVIGPATDGGYYLLGLRYPYTELFTNIDWGSGKVFDQTQAALKKLGLETLVLDELNDLDTWEDLRDLYREALEKPSLQNLKLWPLLTKLMEK